MSQRWIVSNLSCCSEAELKFCSSLCLKNWFKHKKEKENVSPVRVQQLSTLMIERSKLSIIEGKREL